MRVLWIAAVLMAITCTQTMQAQSLGNSQALLDPSGTQFFQNQYLANPAMAGVDTGVHINAAFRRQYTGIEGAPETKYFTADALFGNRVGGGVRVFNDQAGLMNRTRVALSYAYQLPIGKDGQKLRFGLSLALNVQRIDTKNVDGDMNDPSIGAFNRREDYFEGEYGMAYTDLHWNIQAALPNIRTLFTDENKGVDGGGIYYTAISYRFLPIGAISSIEPKICYRGVKGYDNILDAGINIGFLNNAANVMGIYHSTKSVTVGLGFNIKQVVMIQAMYTTQTGGIKTYVDGGYEIGATVNLFGK